MTRGTTLMTTAVKADCHSHSAITCAPPQQLTLGSAAGSKVIFIQRGFPSGLSLSPARFTLSADYCLYHRICIFIYNAFILLLLIHCVNSPQLELAQSIALPFIQM